MVSPQMNEQLLLAQLDPETPVTPDDLRFVLHMCVMDCFDRRVDRQFFHEVLNQYQKGLTLLKQIEIVAHADKLNGTASGLLPPMTKQLRALRLATLEKMMNVAECPEDDDPIN